MGLFCKRSVCGAIVALLPLLVVPGLALAGTISFEELDFTSPVLALGGSGFVSIPANTVAGQYSLGATLSFANDTLDLGGVQITCSSPGMSGVCVPLDIQFQALSAGGGSGSFFFDTSLSGTGSASGFARICIADSGHICSSDGSGSQSINISFNGSISGSNNASFNTGGFDILGDFHLDGLPLNNSVNLPGSFTISMAVAQADMEGPPVGSLVPEPSTMFPLLVVSLFALRRRRLIG